MPILFPVSDKWCKNLSILHELTAQRFIALLSIQHNPNAALLVLSSYESGLASEMFIFHDSDVEVSESSSSIWTLNMDLIHNEVISRRW
jgi:hypothetical protein